MIFNANWKDVTRCNVQKRILFYNCYTDSLEHPVYPMVHCLLRHVQRSHVCVGVYQEFIPRTITFPI